jgi:hypothetical protein
MPDALHLRISIDSDLRDILIEFLGGQREMLRRLAVIEREQQRGFAKMSAEMDRLKASVADIKGVADSAVA